MRIQNQCVTIFFVLSLIFTLPGCLFLDTSTIYDADAYKTATTLKAETLALMSEAKNKYSTQTDDIKDLSLKLDAAYEYAAGRPGNTVVATLWEAIRSPDGDLFGAFLSEWRKSGTLPPVYIDGMKKSVALTFNDIICVEANRNTSAPCQNEQPAK